MKQNKIRCGLLGAQEQDLYVLSELHKHDHVVVAFVYDRDPRSVGFEIAEILGIPRHSTPPELTSVANVDYVVVSEPRARFDEELKALKKAEARILTPPEALKLLCGFDEAKPAKEPEERGGEPYTIDDTLRALEKLFDRQALLKFLLDVAVKSTSASAGSIMLFSAEANELYIAYATGLSERVIKNTRQKLGEGIAGTVALEKQAKLLRLAPNKSLYAKDRERMDIATAISVPLLWDNKLLGVVNVSSGKHEHELNDKDLDTLKKLSRRISRVLSESIKLQEVQVRHQDWNLRSRMGEIAEKSIRAQDKFSLISRYLGDLLGAEAVELYINTQEGDWFVLGGSNRWMTPENERVRCRRGALRRCFLDQRCLVLTESVTPGEDPFTTLTSLVYCPLTLKDPVGVIALEFAERYKLDEFLLVKNSIVLELSRFVASEMRERKLKRELEALGKVADVAPALLSCGTVEDLCDLLARVVGDVLECGRTSVRLRKSRDAPGYVTRYSEPPGERRESWREEDEKRFARLAEKKKPFTLAFLDFDARPRDESPDYHSLLAYPIRGADVFEGGIVAYDKHPVDPLEDAIFSELDRMVLKSITGLVVPVLEAITQMKPKGRLGESAAYESILEGNMERLRTVSEGEMARADRYHHSFSLIFYRIRPLEALFETDYQRALSLVDEITQGVRTRTRKTDFSAWTARGTLAMISLEGSKRIRFLISRIMLYLMKDLSSLEEISVGKKEILVGSAMYPGTARGADDLIKEATANLKPYSPD